MKQQDFDEFCELLDMVAEQYSKTLSEGLKILYWKGLNDFDFPAIKLALSRHLRNTDSGMFMPKIADIAKMLEGSTLDAAFAAWAKVDRAVRSVGMYADVVFDDPLIHRVIHDMGGWTSFGQKTEDEWPFVAREFENRYRGFKGRGEVPEYQPVLIGISNAHNQRNGQRKIPPVMIGNENQAKQVMLGGTNKPMIGFNQAMEGVTSKILHLVETRDAA